MYLQSTGSELNTHNCQLACHLVWMLQAGCLALREEHGQITFENKGLRGTLGHKLEDGENYKIMRFMIRTVHQLLLR